VPGTIYIGADNSVILDELTNTSTDTFVSSATVTFTLYRIVCKDAVTTASSTTLSAASAPFVAGDASRSVVVLGAGANGADLRTTIASYTSAGAVVLTTAPSKTRTHAEVRISVTNATAVAMSYVAASDGKFRGTLDDDVELVNGDTYWIEISADAGSDVKDFRSFDVIAKYRD
jgi:hypothetical protein